MKPRVVVIASTIAVLLMGIIPMHAQTCPPLTQGYWKNHQGVWAAYAPLTLGNNSYTSQQLETILQTPVRGDASIALAHQLIAALLNTAVNNTDPTPIQNVLTDANNLIGSGVIPEGIAPSSPLGQQMENDESVLDDYNNGGITNACQGTQQPS